MTLKTSHPAPRVRPARRRGAGWLLPAGLISFGLIPILANALRRAALAVGAAGSSPGEAGGMPLPVVLHVVGATVFVVLGALQFSAGFRRRRPTWHRIAGRLAILAALLAAGSGLWLAFATLADSSPLLFLFRLLAAAGLALCIILGFRAVRQRRLPQHRAWMIRAFAIGLGAATQVFTLGFGEVIFGRSELSIALLNGAGWAINLAVAELLIHRTPRRVARPAADRIGARG
ncbi:MAG: DUF2306 domain-containing protein [Microbacterium sp.]